MENNIATPKNEKQNYTLDEISNKVCELAADKMKIHDPHCRDCYRFEAAKAAMQGILSNTSLFNNNPAEDKNIVTNSIHSAVAQDVIKFADALLTVLDK